MPFSKPIRETHEITPIGAAYVEALPDRTKAKDVLDRFRKRGIIPGGHSQPKLAQLFGVNQSTISRIVNGRRWTSGRVNRKEAILCQ